MSEKNSFGRRTWDKEEFSKQGALRREKEQNKTIEKVEGVSQIDRDSLNFNKDLNKRQVIASNVVSTRGKSFGFYCEVCDLTFKDNLKYVDHLNSKPHLIRSGELNQQIEVTLDDVKQRYEMLVKKMEEQQNDDEKYDIKKRIAKRQAFEEELKRKRQTKKPKPVEQKTNVSTNNNDKDDNMMSMMGFSGFGSTKK
ncbi:Zinc finger RNA-binding protein [Wickerhamomyces ciferrii]|uniref:Zinc finger RNA-binding protein n=1 Tax=Wickerhamomyces ciferrii (strain ATCC 14091 / BCRC 22168 / CBS 111 / JCM 3599 / NBRC 0793 / NRRL Y-1031 F-60-10) TaxID=1206466 RepID=K0KTH4_WICCF|nr:Zinc finger RNA-binding protein [Wickerhamomyces ciferrii]CCH44679.1 Zinc finger RNA-binding protein [Wickerhamomyces ciferrii]